MSPSESVFFLAIFINCARLWVRAGAAHVCVWMRIRLHKIFAIFTKSFHNLPASLASAIGNAGSFLKVIRSSIYKAVSQPLNVD
jgi:hypothetical protein